MEKKFQFKMDQVLLEKASEPIRSKLDLIRLLVSSLKFALTESLQPIQRIPSNNKMVIYVDKMSRILYFIEDKIFSYQFPFFVKTSSSNPFHLTFSYASLYNIDSISSSLLVAVFNRPDLLDGGLDTIYSKLLEEIVENEWDSIDIDSFCDLIKHLMLFEPGYVRYDHDIEHANGLLHPEHHIDFYYASNNAMKVGLDTGVEENWFVDLLNVLTNCRYLR